MSCLPCLLNSLRCLHLLSAAAAVASGRNEQRGREAVEKVIADSGNQDVHLKASSALQHDLPAGQPRPSRATPLGGR